MAVKLRLKRLGRKHRSFFRLVAIEGRNPRDGRVLEELGFYDPENRVEEQQVRLDPERIKHWLGVGASPSDTVRSLLKKNGIATK
jgi:small subunit ribosomal protein S16